MIKQERKLDDWLSSWKEYLGEWCESPKLYIEWVGISMIAAVLQRKCFHVWEKRIYPNFYIVLVGPAGKARKGTAMNPGGQMLYELGTKMTAQATTREALIRHLKKSSATFTGLGERGTEEIHMYSALTVFSEEFTVFIGYDNKQLMADLADWYDCKDHWIYDTKNKGTDAIEGVFVNLIGATTPELFQNTLPQDAVGGGLLSRTICVYEEGKGQIVVFPMELNIRKDLREHLFYDLEVISAMSGEFTFDDSFKKEYALWYIEQEREVSFDDERLSAYIQRRPTHLRKLCMIVNASRNGGMVINAEDFRRARDILIRTERKMPYTFAGMGKSDFAEIMNKIGMYIKVRQKVTYSSLLRKFIRDVTNESLPIIVATLEKAKFVRIIRQENVYDDYEIEFIEEKKP